MRRTWLAVLILMLGLAAMIAQEKARLSPYTLTREDIFAGPLENNLERFNSGMQKLDALLQENSRNADALVLKGFGTVYLAVRALESGDRADFDRLYREGVEMMEQALAWQPENIGVLATYGATMGFFGLRLPGERQRQALEKGKGLYEAMYRAQENFVERYPVHLKGELLGALADLEQRLGNKDQSRVYLERIASGMADTPYGQKAKQWLENPESITQDNRLLCLTCHEPGRLKNRLAKMGQ